MAAAVSAMAPSVAASPTLAQGERYCSGVTTFVLCRFYPFGWRGFAEVTWLCLCRAVAPRPHGAAHGIAARLRIRSATAAEPSHGHAGRGAGE